jgi:hypothetical protein
VNSNKQAFDNPWLLSEAEKNFSDDGNTLPNLRRIMVMGSNGKAEGVIARCLA